MSGCERNSADTVDACRVYRGNVAAREAVAERSVVRKGLSLQDKLVQPVRSASMLRFEGARECLYSVTWLKRQVPQPDDLQKLEWSETLCLA